MKWDFFFGLNEITKFIKKKFSFTNKSREKVWCMLVLQIFIQSWLASIYSGKSRSTNTLNHTLLLIIKNQLN